MMEKVMIPGFKKTCNYCKRVFTGSSKGIVEHNYEEHVRYCKYKDMKRKIKLSREKWKQNKTQEQGARAN